MYSLDWAYAYGKPKAAAHFKQTPEDFEVHEFFDYPFSGEGEHVFIQIEKKGRTTEEVIKSLSRLTHKPLKMINHAGLKDRQALCTQWLSIQAPGHEIPGIETLEDTGWRVIQSTRHNKKLRPGSLAGNRFIITLKDLSDPEDFVHRIEEIKNSGVPNYFGEQRFGREGGNLLRAEELLVQNRKVKDRFLKGIYCSAARSWLYNLILSKRVADLSWNKPLAGDVMQLSGSHSVFVINEIDTILLDRIKEKDISPASPLAGKTKDLVQKEAKALIEDIYNSWLPWIAGLEKQGLEEAWRANILNSQDLEYKLKDKQAVLSFTLPPGCYATALLRELVQY